VGKTTGLSPPAPLLGEKGFPFLPSLPPLLFPAQRAERLPPQQRHIEPMAIKSSSWLIAKGE